MSPLCAGYIGTASMLEAIAALVKRLRAQNSRLHYVCDPVLGDHSRLYLPQQLVPLYRELVVPLADTLTPNAFEAQLLSGIEVHTEADALVACAALHDMGPSTVVRPRSSCSYFSLGLLRACSLPLQASSKHVRRRVAHLWAGGRGAGDNQSGGRAGGISGDGG